MRLSELIRDLAVRGVYDDGVETDLRASDPEITSIHYRSRDVKPGGVFVAMPGLKADGWDYIGAALQQGAAAVIAQRAHDGPGRVILTDDARKALSAVAARFYGDPSEKLCLIGVTGTNGKTTTSYIIEEILIRAGCRVGVIGTINYRFPGNAYDAPMTTPEAPDIHEILSRMLAAGVTHAVMEVSSHAVDLRRTDHCRFNAALFTNLTQDHLDYHKDMEDYWACKKNLFTRILAEGPKKDGAAAVINCGDPRGRELAAELAASRSFRPTVVGFRQEDAPFTHTDRMVSALDRRNSVTGVSGRISSFAGDFPFTSPLIGKHNIDNILAAAAVCTALNIPQKAVAEGIASLTAVPGRLEKVPNALNRHVFVDYAHTPDALENVLSCLRELAPARLICVFGCGGDRDRAKRPLMGAIAARLSDLSVITSDNPRTEPPGAIIAQILAGVEAHAVQTALRRYGPDELRQDDWERGYVAEPDRKQAIALGIRAARSGDIVLIAGKGHETYQILGKQTIDFDDRKEASRVLEDLTRKRNMGHESGCG